MNAKLINRLLHVIGFELRRVTSQTNSENTFSDQDFSDPEFQKMYGLCSPYTMTSIERMYALYNATKYILDNEISGDFVECGVWKGGSAMLMASCLLESQAFDRHLYLYDTFQGMTKPGDHDINLFGQKATSKFARTATGRDSSSWALATLPEVKRNLALTEFPAENLHFIEGKVEDTIPKTAPSNGIALLRLDTDWYESTKHELEHFYDQLVDGGVLIIDDYGHWSGSKKATIEFFGARREKILLQKVDYSARMGIKNQGLHKK